MKTKIHANGGRLLYSPLVPLDHVPFEARKLFEVDVPELTLIRWRQAVSQFERVQEEILDILICQPKD